jgi:hypothetical protein
MLRVNIIASGNEYQEAAAWAAPTYTQQVSRPDLVSVLLPARQRLLPLLKSHSQEFGFRIGRFPFRLTSPHKFTSQLKCQAFWFAVSQLRKDDLLFLVDADTFCARPLRLSPDIEAAIRGGKVGLAQDIVDRHFQRPTDPWYLAPKERAAYVNSGVILASRGSSTLFGTFLRLSKQRRFLHGPFNDQKVINFAMGKYFRDKLVVLDNTFNAISQHGSPATIIGHCAGGAGYFGNHGGGRKLVHRKLCADLLGRNGSSKPHLNGEP